MNILDIAKKRFSVRSYLDKEISSRNIKYDSRGCSCGTYSSEYAACQIIGSEK